MGRGPPHGRAFPDQFRGQPGTSHRQVANPGRRGSPPGPTEFIDGGAGRSLPFAAFLNPPATGALYSLTADGQRAEPVIPVETFLREFNEQTWKDSYTDFGIAEGPGAAAPADDHANRYLRP